MQKVSLLDCIRRTPQLMETILENHEESFEPLFSYLNRCGTNMPEELVLVGSGTSHTAAATARFFTEKASGLAVRIYLPTDFCFNTYTYNPRALYIFTSQTGTSIEVRRAMALVREKGYAALALTASAGTPLAREAPLHLQLGVGREEYPMRTIGYSCTVFTLMLIGLALGHRHGTLPTEEYVRYLEMAAALPGSQRRVIPAALEWFTIVQRQLLRSRCILFAGAGPLQGLAAEAAVKVWEIPQIISAGYELEESLHGPNYGYDESHCVIVLNHFGHEAEKGLALARWRKEVHGNGLVIGAPVADERDLALEFVAGDFACLEMAPALQVLACRLAEAGGRDLYAPHDNSVMESYFKTHSAPIE